jgi:hypothetical protein
MPSMKSRRRILGRRRATRQIPVRPKRSTGEERVSPPPPERQTDEPDDTGRRHFRFSLRRGAGVPGGRPAALLLVRHGIVAKPSRERSSRETRPMPWRLLERRKGGGRRRPRQPDAHRSSHSTTSPTGARATASGQWKCRQKLARGGRLSAARGRLHADCGACLLTLRTLSLPGRNWGCLSERLSGAGAVPAVRAVRAPGWRRARRGGVGAVVRRCVALRRCCRGR